MSVLGRCAHPFHPCDHLVDIGLGKGVPLARPGRQGPRGPRARLRSGPGGRCQAQGGKAAGFTERGSCRSCQRRARPGCEFCCNVPKPSPCSRPTPKDRTSPRGSITYRTTHITPATLLACIDDWVRDAPAGDALSIVLVGLHACGSLTTDILSAFLASRRRASAKWRAVGAVVVGCCYNLMREGGAFAFCPLTCGLYLNLAIFVGSTTDFPLSKDYAALSVRTGWTFLAHPHPHPHTPPSHPPSAFHHATQVPSEWSSHWPRASLAVRKVAWRGVLASLLPPPQDSTAAPPRLRRLNDAIYADWPTFLSCAAQRMRVPPPLPLLADEDRVARERRLEVLHVLRCLLGPVVETWLVLDRARWVQEELADANADVEVVNLFDQSVGSGRNVAIVVRVDADGG
jgi:hypothetical protein